MDNFDTAGSRITLYISYIQHKSSILFKFTLNFDQNAKFTFAKYTNTEWVCNLKNKDKPRNTHLNIITLIWNRIWMYFRIFSLELVLSVQGWHGFAPVLEIQLPARRSTTQPWGTWWMQRSCFKLYLKQHEKLRGKGGTTSPLHLPPLGHQFLIVLLIPAPTFVLMHPPASHAGVESQR